MNDNVSFKCMLETVKFELRPRDVVVQFCCDKTLTDRANLPPKVLDRSISNLRKSHLNVDNATHYVALNTTKFSIPYAIQMNYNTELEPDDIIDLNIDNVGCI